MKNDTKRSPPRFSLVLLSLLVGMERQRVLAVAAEFGLSQAWLDALKQLPSPQAIQALAELKAGAKATFKKLVLKYHPDRNPGNVEAEARFKLLTPILERVQSLELPARPQPAPQRPQRAQWTNPECVHDPSIQTRRPNGLKGGYFDHARQQTSQDAYTVEHVVFIRV